MKWVLFTMLLCAVGPTQASAQNEISQQLLELDQDQRNAAFTRMLWDSRRKCDHVIRTLFTGIDHAAVGIVAQAMRSMALRGFVEHDRATGAYSLSDSGRATLAMILDHAGIKVPPK